MKKNLLTSIVAFGSMILAFSSCLGDSHNTMETGDTIGYIKSISDAGGITAATTIGYGAATSPEIRNSGIFNPGRFYEMGFKIDSKLGSTNGIANVSDVRFVNLYQDPIPDPMKDKREPSYYPSKPSFVGEKDIEIYPTIIGNPLYHPLNAVFDDYFVFQYSCKLDKKTELSEIKTDYPGMVEILAYYDENNQKQGTSSTEGATEKLKDNQIRINLVIKRTVEGERNPKPEWETYVGLGVINLSEIRRKFEERGIKPETENTTAWGYLQFQYTGEDRNDSKKTEIRTIGNFSEGGTGAIGLALSNK